MHPLSSLTFLTPTARRERDRCFSLFFTSSLCCFLRLARGRSCASSRAVRERRDGREKTNAQGTGRAD